MPDCTVRPICPFNIRGDCVAEAISSKSCIWLGIDVGTGGSRALLVDAEGRFRYSFIAPHEDMRMEDRFGRSRIRTIGGALRKWRFAAFLRRQALTGSAIRGIGLSGQMHGLVLLNAAEQVIRPP